VAPLGVIPELAGSRVDQSPGAENGKLPDQGPGGLAFDFSGGGQHGSA